MLQKSKQDHIYTRSVSYCLPLLQMLYNQMDMGLSLSEYTLDQNIVPDFKDKHLGN